MLPPVGSKPRHLWLSNPACNPWVNSPICWKSQPFRSLYSHAFSANREISSSVACRTWKLESQRCQRRLGSPPSGANILNFLFYHDSVESTESLKSRASYGKSQILRLLMHLFACFWFILFSFLLPSLKRSVWIYLIKFLEIWQKQIHNAFCTGLTMGEKSIG